MRLGFIGLGRMGGPIASHLLRAGHHVSVHDAVPESADGLIAAGAEWAASARDASHDAEVVFTCLPGPPQVEDAVLGTQGIAAGCRPGMIFVDLSSNAPQCIRQIEQKLAAKGCRTLDAPVSGGVSGAKSGTLQIMVGGDPGDFEVIRPLLSCFGSRLSHLGAVGNGTTAKLVHNMIYIATRAVLAEGFTLGVKAGLDPEDLLEVVQGSAFGQGLLLSHFMPEMVLKGQFEPVRFALELALKDVAHATNLARDINVPIAMGALTEQLLVEGIARGWREMDYGNIFRLQEERAGVEVRSV